MFEALCVACKGLKSMGVKQYFSPINRFMLTKVYGTHFFSYGVRVCALVKTDQKTQIKSELHQKSVPPTIGLNVTVSKGPSKIL